MRNEFIALSVVALVVVALGAGYLAGAGGQRLTSVFTTTQTTVSNGKTINVTSTGTSTIVQTTTAIYYQTRTTTATEVVGSTSTTTTDSAAPIPIASVASVVSGYGGSPTFAPSDIVVDPNANRLYVSGTSSTTLFILDASTLGLVTILTLPGDIVAMAVDPGNHVLYALLPTEVEIVNGTSGSIIGSIAVSFDGGLVFDVANDVLYGFSGAFNGPQPQSASGYLAGVDVKTHSVVVNISLGFYPMTLSIDPKIQMVYAIGCSGGFVCGSELALVNATSETLAGTIQVGSLTYPWMAVDTNTDWIFATSGQSLTSMGGRQGNTIYNTDSQTCSPIEAMSVSTGNVTSAIPSGDQVFMIPQDYDFLLAYNAESLGLVNMYSIPSHPAALAYDATTKLMYVSFSQEIIGFSPLTSYGHVNSTLIDGGVNCPLP